MRTCNTTSFTGVKIGDVTVMASSGSDDQGMHQWLRRPGYARSHTMRRSKQLVFSVRGAAWVERSGASIENQFLSLTALRGLSGVAGTKHQLDCTAVISRGAKNHNSLVKLQNTILKHTYPSLGQERFLPVSDPGLLTC